MAVGREEGEKVGVDEGANGIQVSQPHNGPVYVQVAGPQLDKLAVLVQC